MQSVGVAICVGTVVATGVFAIEKGQKAKIKNNARTILSMIPHN